MTTVCTGWSSMHGKRHGMSPKTKNDRSSTAHSSNDTADKAGQLPCRTFIASGCCPYRDRCVYLHDPRVAAPSARSKTRKKGKDDKNSCQDSFFWPSAPCKNKRKSSSVYQTYSVPASRGTTNPTRDPCNEPRKYNDTDALYSMWGHFVLFCLKCANADRGWPVTKNTPDATDIIANLATQRDEASLTDNIFSQCPRLPVFVDLATSDSEEALENPNTVNKINSSWESLVNTPQVPVFNSLAKITTRAPKPAAHRLTSMQHQPPSFGDSSRFSLDSTPDPSPHPSLRPHRHISAFSPPPHETRPRLVLCRQPAPAVFSPTEEPAGRADYCKWESSNDPLDLPAIWDEGKYVVGTNGAGSGSPSSGSDCTSHESDCWSPSIQTLRGNWRSHYDLSQSPVYFTERNSYCGTYEEEYLHRHCGSMFSPTSVVVGSPKYQSEVIGDSVDQKKLSSRATSFYSSSFGGSRSMQARYEFSEW